VSGTTRYHPPPSSNSTGARQPNEQRSSLEFHRKAAGKPGRKSMRKTNFPRTPRILSPDAPRSRHNGPSASDTQSRPEKPWPQPSQPFRLWHLPQTTHLPRTLGMLPFSLVSPANHPSAQDFGDASFFRERQAIPPRKTKAPAAPIFPALASPANHPSAQDFGDASFFHWLSRASI
jgi:hypothetical protein